MGTNYYIFKKCWWCGNIIETHIGKALAGWKFLFQANEPLYKPNIESLWDYLKWRRIEDEYHHKISRNQLFKLIRNKQKGLSNELCNAIDRDGFEWSTIDFF